MAGYGQRKGIALLCVALYAAMCYSSASAVSVDVAEGAPATAGPIRVAAVGFVPKKWDKEANFRTLLRLIEKAAKRKPDLVVAPEGILEGYVIDAVRKADEEKPGSFDKRFLDIAEPLDGKYIVALRHAARRLETYLIVGFAERVSGNRIYNSAVLIGRHGEIVGVYHKNRTIHEKWRPEFYLRGTERPAFETDFGKVGIMICYDRHFQSLADDLKKNGAQIILIPSYGNWGEKNDREMQERARNTGLPVLFVHPNQTLLVDASGKVLFNGKRKEDTYIYPVSIGLRH